MRISSRAAIAQHAALIELIDLRSEIDHLRKFAKLNWKAADEIVKKHDESSAVRLSDAVGERMKTRNFPTPRGLANTFKRAQCLVHAILAAVTQSPPPLKEYECSICLETLKLPVLLPCELGCLLTQLSAVIIVRVRQGRIVLGHNVAIISLS